MPPDDQDLLPHSVEAEQQLLGAILLDNTGYEKIAGYIAPKHFYDPVHARIFEMIIARVDEGLLASPVTLKPALESDAGLQELGGPRYLARLAGSAISGFAIRDYAEMIVDLAAKREILGVCRAASDSIREGSKPSVEIAGAMENQVGAIFETSTQKPLTISYLRAMTEGLELINRAYQNDTPPGIHCGIQRLDKLIGGFMPGNFYILAGRPSMGKTTVGLNFAAAALEQGHGVFFPSLEMPGAQLSPRLLSRNLSLDGVRVPYTQMIKGGINEDQFRSVVETAKQQESLPMLIGERDNRDLSRLKLAARRAQQRMADTACPLGLIIVDYVQLIIARDNLRPYENVSEASSAMKSLAMDLNVPVVAMAQLSRGVEQRDPPVPNLSDLRESGKLEEDADVAMFCYRNAYYLRKKLDAVRADDIEARNDLEAAIAEQRYDLDLIVDKNRHGPTGKARAYVDMAVCRVADDKSPFDGGDLI